MTAELTARDCVATLAALAERLAAARDELCRLDGLVGDGDHGVAMASGFAAAAKAATALDPATATIADVFGAAAKALLNAVGASSGPLYATALLHAAKAVGPHAALPLAAAPALVVAMAEGIGARGQASPGDKTMLDAWAPAARAAEEGMARARPPAETLAAMTEAAAAGAEATKAMVAAKGRAARLGQRSLGHVDPGAASAALIVEVLAGEWLRLSKGRS
jgi:dihydroxyacetone kinase-like protein